LLRTKPATNLTPRKATKPPYMQQSWAATRAPPKHKQRSCSPYPS
jgi:hypothetical protein